MAKISLSILFINSYGMTHKSEQFVEYIVIIYDLPFCMYLIL